MKKLILLLVTIILTSLNVNSQTTLHITGFSSTLADETVISYVDSTGAFTSNIAWTNAIINQKLQPNLIDRYDSIRFEFVNADLSTMNPYSSRIYINDNWVTVADVQSGPDSYAYTYIPNNVGLNNFLYTTNYTDQTGYQKVKFVKFEFSDQAGIEDKDFDVSKLLVYPNPAKDIINIKFNSKESDQPVRIFSLNGQLVYENTDTRQREQNRLEVNISHFSNGLYLIKTGTEPATKLIKIN